MRSVRDAIELVGHGLEGILLDVSVSRNGERVVRVSGERRLVGGKIRGTLGQASNGDRFVSTVLVRIRRKCNRFRSSAKRCRRHAIAAWVEGRKKVRAEGTPAQQPACNGLGGSSGIWQSPFSNHLRGRAFFCIWSVEVRLIVTFRFVINATSLSINAGIN